MANKLINDFTDKLRNAKFTIPQNIFQPLENKVNELKIEIEKLGTPIMRIVRCMLRVVLWTPDYLKVSPWHERVDESWLYPFQLTKLRQRPTQFVQGK